MASISSYLPPFDGLLPKWLLLVSVVALGNSIQAYTTLHYTQRLYTLAPSANSRKPSAVAAGAAPSAVTPLSARTFGTWTFLSAIIRFYAAYHIDEPLIYQLALWTYALAFAHFASEWLVFRTASWNKALAGPVIISTSSMVWMWSQWGYYVRA